MLKSYSGTRRGISLVEMMIAVILFGVIAIVGFKYSTNYLDTSLTGKKARVSALVEQATQLSNAYDIYSAQMGVAPESESNLTEPNVGILTSLPTTITEMGSIGWKLTENAELTATGQGAITGGNTVAFYFDLTQTTTKDAHQYCAIMDNMIDKTTELNVTSTSLFDDGTYNIGDSTYSRALCVGTTADGGQPFRIFFVK